MDYLTVKLSRWPCILAMPMIVTVTMATLPLQNRTWPHRVYNGQSGFPTFAHFTELINSLDGKHASPLDAHYANVSAMTNTRVLQTPAMHLLVESARDIQKVMVFARLYNVHLCIRSSGHSYIGRSTHGGGVVINMVLMRGIDVKVTSSRNPAGEVTVQSGASWIEVYTKIDTVKGPGPNGGKKIGRVVVGGSAHTVAMGGYTMGGGHAPIGRRFGLAVDNLLEAKIVTVDGKLLTLTADKTIIEDVNGTTKESSDTSLFWAIRGGGGGTWGVVVSFTYKLHYAPERFRNLVISYPLFSATGERVYEDSVRKAIKAVSKMSEDWGGYIVLMAEDVPYTTYKGSMLLFLNHHGSDSSASNNEANDLVSSISNIYKTDTNYKTFLEYEVNAQDALYFSTYIANTFVQSSTINNAAKFDNFIDFIYSTLGNQMGCTLTMIGGSVMQSNSRPATPVHPAFRDGLFSASCGTGWAFNPVEDARHVRKALDMAEELYVFGEGAYFNEPAEDMEDWKERFWKDEDTYQRLLDIKKQHDPDNYLWCHNCVGSDLGTGYGLPAISPSPSPTTGVDFGTPRDCDCNSAMAISNPSCRGTAFIVAIILIVFDVFQLKFMLN